MEGGSAGDRGIGREDKREAAGGGAAGERERERGRGEKRGAKRVIERRTAEEKERAGAKERARATVTPTPATKLGSTFWRTCTRHTFPRGLLSRCCPPPPPPPPPPPHSTALTERPYAYRNLPFGSRRWTSYCGAARAGERGLSPVVFTEDSGFTI